MPINKPYGWIPDVPDQRDFWYRAIKPVIRVPKKVDISGNCSLIEDQGRLGSCTACALAGNLEYLEIMGTVPAKHSVALLGRGLSPRSLSSLTVPAKHSVALPGRGLSPRSLSSLTVLLQKAGHPPLRYGGVPTFVSRSNYTDVSRLFIYYNERFLRGNQDYDSGASLRDGIKTLKKLGYCWEKTWPYIISRFNRKPPRRCYVESSRHLINSYHRIADLSEMLVCLAQGYPFVFGFTVYESFQAQKVARTGIVNMPKKNERVLGGHAVLAVGYDQKEKRFLVRNSWGNKWGMKGYFSMPFEYLESLASDFWTIRK